MFLGLLRTVVYIVGVWFIWRWLDGAFGGRRNAPRFGGASQPPPSSKGKGRRADDSKEGEYIDFEEVKD
ncbi:MAG: hypothetical protein ACPF8U_01255 [Flavobacteriales bacterium]|jgi:hypothetical protein|nr:hypothetical protein [Bacteroidota bacterium]MEC8803092.1 hypothetical protein [Bacteroidota bacterium]